VFVNQALGSLALFRMAGTTLLGMALNNSSTQDKESNWLMPLPRDEGRKQDVSPLTISMG
jgi:hypothetical protein